MNSAWQVELNNFWAWLDNKSEVTGDWAVGVSGGADSLALVFLLNKWCAKHNVILGIIRPSLIAGVNAPGNLGAMVRGIKTGRYLSINHGKAKKSVLMAEDIARLIPKLAEVGGIYNVCDSHNPSFGELEHLIASQLGKKTPVSIPYWFARCLAFFGDFLGNKAPINSDKLMKITELLLKSSIFRIYFLQ